ncbi:MAG: hypothetical protein KAQ89_00050 [Planctomycetes bacterium]|nr:hypothetical protein [Planctomycetota bacterium]
MSKNTTESDNEYLKYKVDTLETQAKHLIGKNEWLNSKLQTNQREYIHRTINKDAILQPDPNPKLLQNARCLQLSNIYNEALNIQDTYPCSSYMAVISDHIYRMINKKDNLKEIAETMPSCRINPNEWLMIKKQDYNDLKLHMDQLPKERACVQMNVEKRSMQRIIENCFHKQGDIE